MKTKSAEDKAMIPLQFPNARLFLHQMIASEHLSGAEAIARGAYEFGLVKPGSMKDDVESLPLGRCNCLTVAKTILTKHFEQIRPINLQMNIDEVSSQIERDVNSYHFDLPCNGVAKGNGNPSHCNKFAPALFDLILQHIQRYS